MLVRIICESCDRVGGFYLLHLLSVCAIQGHKGCWILPIDASSNGKTLGTIRQGTPVNMMIRPVFLALQTYSGKIHLGVGKSIN